MPEAPVNKDHHALFPKCEVRPAHEFHVSAPSRNPSGAQELHKRKLRILVASPAYAGHHRRTLLLGENVGHQVVAAAG
jgi:hypothetical protein